MWQDGLFSLFWSITSGTNYIFTACNNIIVFTKLAEAFKHYPFNYLIKSAFKQISRQHIMKCFVDDCKRGAYLDSLVRSRVSTVRLYRLMYASDHLQ